MEPSFLRQHYDRLATEELLRLQATDLTADARVVLEEELASRDDTARAAEAVSARVTSLKPLDQGALAPLWRRFIAGAVDAVGLLLVLFAVNFPLYVYTPKSFSDLIGYGSLVLAFVYLFFKDGMRGQSLGKRLLKIKVLERSTGDLCGLPRSFVRNMFNGLGIFDWVFALGKESRRLGDLAAGTYVVNA